MPRRNRHKKTPLIGEDTRIAVNLTLKKLLETPDQKELEFPSSYTAEERAYIHKLAYELGLKSKSRGKGTNRFLTVYKREGSTIVQADAVIKLQKSSRQSIYNLLQAFPLNHKECQDLLPPIERERPPNTDVSVNTNTKAMGRLNNSVPQIPQLKTNFDVLNYRKALPIFNFREDILDALNNNQVVIIGGETGSGKTTQVPQFILEHCQQRQQPCRIICTQPRRLSAVSVAERVAFERDEKIGQTFGYQIRLESRVAPKTLLTYCTNGVLLRTLMAGDSALSTVTHVIVDEVHERDRFCDFLLIALKDALQKHKSLKLVLMSATLDVNIFVKYFNKCAVINVLGRSYDVDTYFLEDVLKMTGYMTKEMLSKRKEFMNKKDQHKILETWTQYKPQQSGSNAMNERCILPAPILAQQNEPVPEKVKLEPWLAEEMDKSISDAWLRGGEDNFAQLLYFILSENVSVDYQHSTTLVTPLMVAAGKGCINTTEQLLNLNLSSLEKSSTNIPKQGRGFLVSNFIISKHSATSYLDQLHKENKEVQYNPFLLVLLNLQNADVKYISNSRTSKGPTSAEDNILGFSNGYGILYKNPNYINGRILDETLSKPIIECNSHCTCKENCDNRVVQNGPLDSLFVSEIDGKGHGLFTTKYIKKGQFICEYAGEVVSIEEARRRVEMNKNSMNYVLVVSEHIGDQIIVTCIDPKHFGNIGRYSNHSCEPNTNLVPIRVEGPVPRLCLFASRDIKIDEEITFNYAGGITNSIHNFSHTICLCGSTNCQGYLPHNPI